MTEKIVDGDYVKSDIKTDLIRVENIDEILQNIVQLIPVHRGSFYPNKNYGSNLFRLDSTAPIDEYALSYIRQAVDSIDGVYVKSVKLEDDALLTTFIINDEERQALIKIENNL